MFVVASDDLEWCRKNLARFSDVVLVDKASAISDLALLSSLDHQISSHGTYGLFIIFLSEAETVAYPAPYYNNRYGHHAQFDRLNLSNFVQIDFEAHK